MYDLRTYYQKQAEKLLEKRTTLSSDIQDAILARKKKADSTRPSILMDNPLTNLDAYGPYRAIAEGDKLTIDAQQINQTNWLEHYESILNIMKDGIYSDYVQSYMIHVVFGEEGWVDLSIPDYYNNLMMWRLIINLNEIIHPYHVVFDPEIRARHIKSYIDEFVIDVNRFTHSNRILSNDIADSLHYFHNVDIFANYLANTLNLEDSATLMTLDKAFYDSLHRSYKTLQVDQVNDAIMKDAQTSIECIRNAKDKLGHDHCLVDVWRTNEGLNQKQYAEVTNGIGVKPDGRGGIFSEIVDASFIGGGLTNPVDYFIESSTSRIAQIEKHKNVSKSGVLARIMSINNTDTQLYPDDSFDCCAKNLIPVEIKTPDHLKHLNMRYYRLFPNGQEKCINYKTDQFLIGKTILLRSPITCASHAKGHGVCRKCYGNLAYSVHDYTGGFGINIGCIASELVTSKQTQKQLSAKHILKASIDKIEWSFGFYILFEMENTVVRLSSDLENPKDYVIYIDQDAIESDSEYEGSGDSDDETGEEKVSYSDNDEYIIEFDVLKKSTGETYHITTNGGEKLFITNEFAAIIRNRALPTDDKIAIPLSAVKENPLFTIKVRNNEISKVLIKLKNLFNRSIEVRGKTVSELLQEIIDTDIEGDMGVSSVHYEVMLSNQVRDPDDVLSRPDWGTINPPYRILTLDEALTKNPSVTDSLSYQKITKSLYNPLTYQKSAPSYMDYYFAETPMKLIKDISDEDVHKKRAPGEMYEPFTIVDDVNTITAEDTSSDDDGTIIDVEE